MDWDQIESKWAAMTRRVRSDLPCAKFDTKAKVGRRTMQIEGSSPVIADRQTGAASDDRTLTTLK